MLGCDICVSFTGNAGPSAMENKPAGLVYIGIAYKDECRVYEQNIKEIETLFVKMRFL